MFPLETAYVRFCELVRQSGGDPRRPDPGSTWRAFLAFIEEPFGYGDPPERLDDDRVPVEILRDDGLVTLTFARNMHRPWSEEHAEDPVSVGASFEYAAGSELDGIEERVIWARGGPAGSDPSVSGSELVGSGRLGEESARHPEFDRLLAPSGSVRGRLFFDDPADEVVDRPV